jgi:lyso-ornithine lipid O-acyltransferase
VSALRATFIAIGFLLLTLPLMPLQWLLLQLDLSWARQLPHLYHKLVCRLLRVTITVEGHVPKAGLIVSNHVSWLDIPVLTAICPVTFIAKKEVERWPLFGALARLQNSVFVDRESRQSTGPSRDTIVEKLEAGQTLVLFPEGTSYNGRLVKPFKSSFFGAVEHGTVPVYPVTLIYLSQSGLPLNLRQRPGVAWFGDMEMLPHLWAFLKGGPIKVLVIVHDPVNPTDFTHRKSLAAACEAVIKTSLAQRLHAGRKMG